jgi:hypothetical protein
MTLATTDTAFSVLAALTLLAGCSAIPIPGGKLAPLGGCRRRPLRDLGESHRAGRGRGAG